MRWGLTPARRRGVELLDDPGVPEETRRQAMGDVARANGLFGGTRAMVRALRAVLPRLPRQTFLVDVGVGLADVPAALAREARQHGVSLTVVGLDIAPSLLLEARPRLAAAAAADARRLPLRDACADVVCCSQLLHHFADAEARAIVAELHRVTRGWVIIGDLRRSWVAAGGFWLASAGMRFHRVTRHDGVTSVLRGFTPSELASVVLSGAGVSPRVRRGAFWRLTAVWNKADTR